MHGAGEGGDGVAKRDPVNSHGVRSCRGGHICLACSTPQAGRSIRRALLSPNAMIGEKALDLSALDQAACADLH